jgi:AcrR family transcriptional regulator
MSSTLVAMPTHEAPVRRHLTERQADTVQRLTEAVVDELRDTGYDGLTVRNVARRAQVAPATAYTYFSSKDHLVAEVFWRRLQSLSAVRIQGRPGPAARVMAALGDLALLVADEPRLAAACTTALLANDPDVKRLRDRIGGVVVDRLTVALGPDAEPAALRALELAFSGAMLQAGMGYLAYHDLAGQMAEVATLVVGRRR